ncbi:Ig-like domain-containing protein [Oryzomonas rubra]|uniref:Ig-like domain-containing protein n=1 Tax=Oryzomonas rubra TaxID=2509454 RepID=UPI001C3F6F3E|nr:Ig-like domain-containing protein [Oryzomonas rubra]
MKDLAGNTNSYSNTTFTTANVADTTVPTVTSVTPANNATGVGRNATIALTFSESVNPSTVTSTSVQVFAGATSIGTGSISFSADNRTVTFTPTAPAGSTITIVATSDIKDLSGNSLVNFQSRYQTADDAPPLSLTSVTPLNSATGIPRNVKVILTFSNSLNPTTVNSNSIQVLAAGAKLTVNPSISSDNRTVTLSTYLPPSTVITVIANTDILDVNGNSLTNFQSQFTTAADISSSTPQVVTMRPGNDATNVPPNSVITLFTSGNPLNPATVQNALHIVQNGILVAGTVQLSGNNQAIEFTPSSPLAYGTVIQAFLDATAQDIYGNALQSFSGQFTVQGNPASTAPRLLAANPYNGATNVALNVIPQFEFDQPLAAATVNATSVRLYDNCTGQVVAGTVSLVSGGNVGDGNNVVQFQPQGPLTASCNGSARTYRYQMNVFGGTITGTNGLAAPGVNYSFTVGSASDTSSPTVVSVAPPNGSTGVGINGIVVVTFNKPVNTISVNSSTIRIIYGSQAVVPTSISFDSTGAIVTITPQVPLPVNTQVAFAINGVTDLEGNLFIPFAAQFTTSVGPDTTKPTILAVTPLSGTSISRNGPTFTVQFSKPMDPISINPNTLFLFDSTTNLNIPGIISSNADLTTFSFSPGYATNGSFTLTSGDSIYLKVNGTQDLAGNGADATTYYYTVSSGQSVLEPSINSFAPINAVVGTHVAISGSNFDNIATNNTVKFNGVVATVINATETQLIAIVPTGATTGPITVSTSAGAATTASQFIVGTRDTIAPTTTIIAPTQNRILSGDYFTVTGTVSDIGYGAALVELSLDNGASWQEVWHSWYGSNSWSYNWALPTVGTFTLKARGTDVSGNVGSESTVAVTVANGDFTAPTINPIPAVVPATLVTIIGSKLPRAVQMKVSCGAAVVENLTITSATSWKATISGLTQGQNTVTAYGIDSTGTTSATATMTFTVDTIPPVAATSFAATTVSTGVKLDWSNSSSADMLEYRLYWDNGSGVISYATPIAVIPFPTNNFTIAVPNAGTYHFGLRAVDTAGNEEKNTNMVASATVNGYSVSVSVTGNVHQRGQNVSITGLVVASDSTPLVNIPVTIEIESRGYIRIFTAYTKASGTFSYSFQPMATEAGSYTVRAHAVYQGLEKSSSASFSIIGMLLDPAIVNIDMSMNSPRTVNINLTNIGSTGMTNLQYALADNDLSDPVKGFIDTSSLPTSLAAGASVVIPVLIIADPGPPPTVPAVFTLNITSSEGSNESASITAQLHDAVGLPVASPDPIMAGVRIGSPVTKTITITNQGYASMQNSTLTVHDTALYGWVSIPNGTFGQFGPQEAKSCQIVVNPPEGTTLGTYVVQLDLNYNGITKPIYMTVEITTATVGQVAYKVHDDTGSVVSGAAVNLISKAFYVNVTPTGKQEYNNVIKGTTDQQGYILFNDVPAGDYRYVVSADRHDQKDGTITVEPGSTTQTIGVIMVTNLVNVDFSVVQTTIQDQYNVNLNITYVTDLIKPTLYVSPYRVDLSFFPEETSQGVFTIQNTSNNAPVRGLTLDSSSLDATANELKVVFDDGTALGTQNITLGDLAPGQSVQVSYKAIIYGTSPKLDNRNLGNIVATAKYTYSIDGQAYESTTTTPVPVLYWKPQDFSLPGISYVNDETGGKSCNLQYQGNTYRMSVKSNRNMGVTLDTLKAVNQVNGGPDAGSIISDNSAIWNGSFTPTTLHSKGDVATFDIDDLTSDLTARCSSDRSNFKGKPNFIGFGAVWTDRNPTKDSYLIPISIITKSDTGVNIVDSTPGGGWVGGTVPTFNDHGSVKLQIDQKLSLEREAFNSTLSITPSVTPLDNFSANISIKDANGNDASELFQVLILQNSGIASGAGSSVSGPVGITWQLIPKSSAGGTTADGQTYSISATLNYNFSGGSYSYTTQPVTVTVKPMPKLAIDYKLPYITMAGKPVKIKVIVTNNGYGPAHNLVISSAQPKIVENLNNIPISFTLLGSSATPNDNTLQNGVLDINFEDIQPGGTAEGYWLLSTSKDGYFVEFTSTLKHQDYMGVTLDPLIVATNTHLVPAIGGEIFMPPNTSEGMKVELSQSGVLISQDTVNAWGNYLIPDLTAGSYQWVLKDSSGNSVSNKDIIVVDGQPTATIDYDKPNSPQYSELTPKSDIGTGKNLVLITHGYNDNAHDDWLKNMVTDVCSKLGIINVYDNGVSYGCFNNNWEVLSYDWSKESSPPEAPIWTYAFVNGYAVGEKLASQIAGLGSLGYDYKYIHFIAHSAGSNVINKATEDLKIKYMSSAVIVNTFLDAYDMNPDSSSYGNMANWAEQYVDKRILVLSGLDTTNVDLKYAFNFDVTGLDPTKNDADVYRRHDWPYLWYDYSVSNRLPDSQSYDIGLLSNSITYGFNLVPESGQMVLPSHNMVSSDRWYPRGWGCDLASPTIFCGTTSEIYNNLSPKAIFKTIIPTYNNNDNTISKTGTIDYSEEGVYNITTGSPAWINISFEISDKINALNFDYVFNSNTDGLLNVYLDGVKKVFVDGNNNSNGLVITKKIALGEYGNGKHTLTLRLDAFSKNQVKVKVSNLQFGYVQITNAVTTGDTAKPISSITNPISNTSISGNNILISGTADDGTGSGVNTIEVSLDGGSTWILANGTISWQYLWNVPSSGTYTVMSRATDNAGNIEVPATGVTFTVSLPDLAAPTGSIVIQAADNYTKSTSVTLALAANDPSGVTQMCISNTGTCTAWQPFAQSLPWLLTNGDGLKTVRAWFKDSVGNSNSQPYIASITLDTAAPVLSVSTLPNGAYTNNAILNLSGAVTDSGSGLKQFTINDIVVTVNPDGTYSQAVTLVSGANTVTVIATDNAGNQTTNSRTITYDTTAPVIIITSPADNSAVASQNVEIKGSVDKNALVTVKVNSGSPQNALMNGMAFSSTTTLVPGANTIEVTATDLAGNSGTAKRTVMFDNQQPSLAIIDPIQDISTNLAGWLLKGTVTDTLTETTVAITVDGQTFQPQVVNGTFSQQLNFTTEKTYTITVIATDAAGNKTTVLRNIIYDTTKPLLSADVTSPTRLASQTISGTREADAVISITSSTASVGAVAYPTGTTWNTSIDNMTYGINHIVVTARDFAGNETVVTRDILFDASPPTNGSLSALPGNGQVSLSWGYTDNLSGIDHYRLVSDVLAVPASCENGSVVYEGSATAIVQSGLANGVTVYYLLCAYDQAGNESAGVSASATPVSPDTTPPTGTVTINSGASATNALQVVLGISATDPSGVPQMCISNTETCTAWQSYAQSLLWQLPNGDGQKTVHAWFKDGVGNTNTQPYSASITLDTAAPVLAVSTLPNGAYTNNPTLNLSGTVADVGNGIKQLTVNGMDVPVDAGGSFSHPVGLVAGANTVTTIALDNAGNQTSDTRAINYDPNAPLLTIILPADNMKTNKPYIDVTGTIDKTASVAVKVNNNSPDLAAITANKFAYTANLVAGANTILVTATDLATNSTTAKRTVVYDNQNPTLSITEPAQDITTSQNSIDLKGAVADAFTAVTVTVTVDGQTFNPPVVNGAFEQPITFTTAKTYAITVTATDEAMNSTSVQRNIIYAPQKWSDITPSVTLTKSGTLYDSVNNCYYVNISIKNTGTAALNGALRLVISNPSIPIKTLQTMGLKPSGTAGTETYFEIVPAGSALAAGSSLSNQRVNFNMVRVPLTYGVRVDQFE